METFDSWSLHLGIGGLILYMIFIIYRLGKESGAGRFGYFVLFFSLGLGFVGYLAKTILVEFLHI
ncbi:MAG: DUF2788 domain-containing protein [Acidiferrobacteraceae bacterium]|jgi:hypothetical protein